MFSFLPQDLGYFELFLIPEKKIAIINERVPIFFVHRMNLTPKNFSE